MLLEKNNTHTSRFAHTNRHIFFVFLFGSGRHTFGSWMTPCNQVNKTKSNKHIIFFQLILNALSFSAYKVIFLLRFDPCTSSLIGIRQACFFKE